jgi:hypothetical protein
LQSIARSALCRLMVLATLSMLTASRAAAQNPTLHGVVYFRRMTDSPRPAFVLMGGDLIRDAMSQTKSNARSYFDLYAAESKSFRAPVWTIPGNYDHYGIIRSRSHADSANPLYNRGM